MSCEVAVNPQRASPAASTTHRARRETSPPGRRYGNAHRRRAAAAGTSACGYWGRALRWVSAVDGLEHEMHERKLPFGQRLQAALECAPHGARLVDSLAVAAEGLCDAGVGRDRRQRGGG